MRKILFVAALLAFSASSYSATTTVNSVQYQCSNSSNCDMPYWRSWAINQCNSKSNYEACFVASEITTGSSWAVVACPAIYRAGSTPYYFSHLIGSQTCFMDTDAEPPEPDPDPEPEPQNCEALAGQTVYLSYPYDSPRPTSHNGCQIVLTNGGVEVCSGSPPTTCSATFEYTGAPGGDGGGGGPGGDPGGGDPGGGDPGGGDPGGGDPGGGDPGGGDCDEGDEDCTPGGGSGPGDCDEGDEDCTPGGGSGPGDGDGDGDGGGSASSGLNCNVSPQCSGPAIECAMFFEMWRNRCSNPMMTEISDDTQQLIVENVETTGTALLDSYEEGFLESIGTEWGVEFDADAGTPLLDLLSGNACTNYKVDIPVLLGRGGNSSFGVDCSDTKVVRDVLGWGFSVLACFMIYGLIRKPVNR